LRLTRRSRAMIFTKLHLLAEKVYDRISYRSIVMNLTVYIPRSLQEKLRQRARAEKLSPSRYLQQLLRQDFEDGPQEFSARFAALAGSWEDDRSSTEIVRDIEDNRIDAERPEMT